MKKNLVREPLVHFLVIGGLLLALVSVCSRGDGREGNGVDAQARRIHVDSDVLMQFVQAKTQIEDPDDFAASWRDLDASARADWLDRFIREEALVREARRLGLDQQDDLIRRRLVQQIEFVALGRVETGLEFGPEELEEIYGERKEDYRVPASFDFSHVFLRIDDGVAGAEEEARSRAVALLRKLNAEGIATSEAQGRGDRFLYNRNYIDRTRDEVISHFGEAMGAALGDLEPDAHQWQGPLRSTHGFHLVLLLGFDEARLPGAEEIRELLHEDWLRKQREVALDRAVAEIVSRYQVEIDSELELVE
jgi:PPIC-type PPIASE domain